VKQDAGTSHIPVRSGGKLAALRDDGINSIRLLLRENSELRNYPRKRSTQQTNLARHSNSVTASREQSGWVSPDRGRTTEKQTATPGGHTKSTPEWLETKIRRTQLDPGQRNQLASAPAGVGSGLRRLGLRTYWVFCAEKLLVWRDLGKAV
jgi:hypothetical protein